MGQSVAVDSARLLLSQIEAVARGRGEPAQIAALLEQALTDEATLLYLAIYLSRCLTGSVPDYRIWLPLL